MDDDIIRFFTQSPNFLFYGLPDLAIQDKWALLALMSMCWDRRRSGMTLKDLEGPYKLSLREISTITGIDHTSLRGKEGKDPRVGVLKRLQALDYISIVDARPINEMTGSLGRKQTYLYIHLERIWIDNASFFETWKAPTNKLVSESSFEIDPSTVDVDNVTVDDANNEVDQDNSMVDYANSEVGHVNDIVDNVNHTVDAVSTNLVLIRGNTTNTLEEKEDGVSPSSNQNQSTTKKPITPYFLESYIKDLLKAAGEYWNRKEHTQRLAQIYLDCDLTDEEIFKDKITRASNEAMMYNNDLEYFYRYLRSALHLERAN